MVAPRAASAFATAVACADDGPTTGGAGFGRAASAAAAASARRSSGAVSSPASFSSAASESSPSRRAAPSPHVGNACTPAAAHAFASAPAPPGSHST